MISAPVFRRKPKLRERELQVRFFCEHKKYAEFKDLVKGDGFNLQDVFDQFIDWYIEKARRNAQD